MSADSILDQPSRRIAKEPQPDSCWSWVVCLACALTNIIICGVVFSYGIIFPTLLEQFRQGKATTALAGSLALFGQGLFSPLVARVYNRVGPRTTTLIGVIICSGALVVTSQGSNMYVILVTYGGFFGFGSCFVFFPTYLVIPSYFVKRRSLALGLLAMGPGGGLFLISAIVEALLNVLHWRWTFMVLAGLVVFIIPLVCTIRRVPNMEEQSVNNNVEQKGTCCERTFSPFRNKRFDVITLSMSLYYAVHYIPLVHMARYCEDVGMSSTQASRLYLYSGLTSLLFRPVIGRLCDVKWIDACYVYQLAAFINGVATLLLPLARTYPHFVLYFVVWGFADGTNGCSVCVAIIACFTSKQRNIALSVSFTITCVVGAAGPALGGLLADEYGSYIPTFYMTGIVIVVSAAVIFLLPFVKSKNQRTDLNSDEIFLVVEKCTVV